MMDAPQSCRICGQPLTGLVTGGRCLKCLAVLAFTPEEIPDSVEPPASHQSINPSIHQSGSPRPSSLRHFGDYELIEEIARGGMGVVFKARQMTLGRIVAVKMLLSGQFAHKEFIGRFRAEARAAANLQHPNIVAIHEIGEHDGQQYFSMDYVDGGHLGDVVREQPLPAKRAATLLKTVAEAIHYAHQRGVVHRDLKPSNILIDAKGQPRVTDFGLAKQWDPTDKSQIANRKSQMTLTGQVIGTPGFMAPEQAGARRDMVGPASDVYSLGAVLYFLVTGRAPFTADSLEETLRQIHDNEPVSPRLLNPALPRDLETICLKCLSKEPLRRYHTADALAEDLGRFLSDETICARPVGKAEKLWRWSQRKPALAASIVALNLVAAVGLAGILWQWRRAEVNFETARQHSIRAEQHAARETAQRLRAEDAVTSLELQRVEDLLEKDEVVMGMAYLARIVRQQPTNQVATRRLFSALTQRNFALPLNLPLRHDKRVWHAEFSPDGQSVVTASLDLTAAVWDVRTGQKRHTLPHPNAVRYARFSPDGSRIITVADDFRARIWNAKTGLALGQMPHSKRIGSASFSPDGRHILTACDDGAARVWDGQTGEPVLKPLNHTAAVVWAQFTSDGERIATASDDKTAQLWDASTGRAIGPPLQHHQPISYAHLSPAGNRFVTTVKYATAYLWGIPSGKQIGEPFELPQHIGLVGFSPEGERIVTETGLGAVQLWNAPDWSPLAKPMMHRHNVSTAQFSPEGQRLLTASMDGTARLWDVSTGEPFTAPLEHDDLVWSARFSPDGDFVVTACADQTARIWDVRPGLMRNPPLPSPTRQLLDQANRRTTHAVRSAISRLARRIVSDVSPSGDWAVNGWDSASARLWDTRILQPTITLSNAELAMFMRFSPDGARLATCSHEGVTRIWDARDGREISRINQVLQLGEVKFSPDGRWLAGGGVDWTLRQWNVFTGAPRGEPLPHRGTLQFFCYSPDGERLVTSDFKDDVVWLYEASTGRLLARTPPREGRAMHADFSPDGHRLITASEDGTARIWDGHSLQPLVGPLRHKGSVTWAKFSHDGRWAVTGAEYGAARVWNTDSGEPIGEPMNHRASVFTAEFSPDDRLLVTAAQNGAVRLWDSRTGRPVSESLACEATHLAARFSTDGRRVIILQERTGPQVWDVPPIVQSRHGDDEPSSTILADLAEAVMGKRVNTQGALEIVSSVELVKIRQRVADLPPDDDITRWLQWFFADRSTRTISPYSLVTMPQYIQTRIEDTNQISWREALMVCPTNSSAYAQMARYHLQQSQDPSSPHAAYADWASRQAVKFATERSQP